jgi:hypothetical protein
MDARNVEFRHLSRLILFPFCLCSCLGATSAPTLVAMTANHAKIDERTRQSLRLDPGVWTAIDTARMGRAGSISRNTWITEAIAEKLAREQDYAPPRRKVAGGYV